MANFGVTTKWALRKLLGTSNANDIDAGFAALADDVDAKLTPSDQGLFASRPVSTGGSPGKIGRTYKSTDGFGGESFARFFRDNGTGWDEQVLVPPAAQVWQTSTLPAGLGSGSLAYYKDPLGIVRFRGDKFAATGGSGGGIAANGTLVTMPAGYRPGTTHYGVAHQQEQSPGLYPISITTAGVMALTDSALISGLGGNVVFSALSYRAEN